MPDLDSFVIVTVPGCLFFFVQSKSCTWFGLEKAHIGPRRFDIVNAIFGHRIVGMFLNFPNRILV